MKTYPFRNVKLEATDDLDEPIKTIARLNNWQIFALALPVEPAAIIYLVASFPLSPKPCASAN